MLHIETDARTAAVFADCRDVGRLVGDLRQLHGGVIGAHPPPTDEPGERDFARLP